MIGKRRIPVETTYPNRRIYRFEYALAALLAVALALPVPIMLARGLTGRPSLIWRRGIPRVENVATLPGDGPYARWRRTAGGVTDKTAEFQAAFARSYGLRVFLRQWHGRIAAGVFGVSPAPEVIVGKSGWLFLASDQALDGYRGIDPFTAEELERLRRSLADRKTELEKQGIAFLVVLPPDKQTIYPEFMPDVYTRIGPSRLEQTIAYLREHPGVDCVDLRPALEAAKEERPERPLFLKLDTHWNMYGAFFGYRAAAAELKKRFPQVRPYELSEFVDTERLRANADLTGMLGQEKKAEPEPILTLRSLPPNLPESAAWGYLSAHTDGDKTVITEYPTGEIGRAVIFHDSYMQTMSLYLTRHFRHAVWHWGAV